MTRILVFSPYALWEFHTLYEDTIAKACRLRGAAVEYLLCDGLLPECDQHWDSKENAPRSFDICNRCQMRAKNSPARSEFPYRWLGEFVTGKERATAFAWAHAVPAEGMRQAQFHGMPLGEWVLSSMNSYFRQYPPDLTDWHVVSVYRGFLYGAAIGVTGLQNYLRLNPTDAALLFNGRQSITRVALDVFKQNGIRVLTHERAEYQLGYLNAKPDEHCMSPRSFRQFWRSWSEVALEHKSLDAALLWLIERRYGANLSWISYNESSGGPPLRERLNLTPGKRFWVLFTSSSDEVAGDPLMQGPYDSQHEWVRDVIRWVALRSDVELAIKVHPNLGGNSYIGKSEGELRVYNELRSNAPSNVRFIFPEDPISAYELADEADLGLTYGSTIGLEMAMLGKPVFLAARASYEQCPSIIVLTSKDAISAALDRCLTAAPSRQIRREAFRLAYYYIFRFEMPFPAITVFDLYRCTVNYKRPEEFTSTEDQTLDHLCNYLVRGDPLFDQPTVEERSRDTSDEDRFFAEIESDPNYLRNPHYDRWLRMREWGRSVKKRLQKMPCGVGNVFLELSRGSWQAVLKKMETRNSDRVRS